MENIDLARFNFDISGVLEQAAKLKAEMEEIKAEQKEMDKTSPEFVQTEADLRRLRKEYNEHIKVINQASEATQEVENRQERLNAVLDQEVTSIKEAREQNKVLNALRNETNLTTEEGRAELALLNEQLDRNNQFIKENVDAYTQQKINIGNYREDIKGAAEDLNIFNGGLSEMISRSQDAGGASQILSNSLKSTTVAIQSTTKAALAFIATPVGAVLAAIAAAFLLVRNAMQRSEDSTNKLRKAFSAFQGITTAVQRVLEPLGEFLIDTIVVALEKTEEAAMSALRAISRAASWLGWDAAADSVDRFTDSLEQNAQANRELAESEAQLRKSQRQSRLVQLEYQKQAEELRQIRDDEALSFQERIRANEELGRVLEQQMQDELQIAYQALDVVKQRIALEGETEDLLDAQADALVEIADIEERITGQRSEQLTNRRSLEREMEEERKKAIEDREKLETKAAEKAKKEAEKAIDALSRELDERRKLLEERLSMQVFLSEEEARLRKEANDALLAEEKAFHKQRLKDALINQEEYDHEIRMLELKNRDANREIDREREKVAREEERALREIEFAKELDEMIANNANAFNIERAQEAEQRRIKEDELALQREQGLISEKLYNAQLAELDRQAKKKELEREKALQEQKLDIAEGMMAAAAKVIDQNSAAGKAIAIAQALINTYRGISAGVALGFPQAIPAVAYATATGFKAVKDIAKQDVPSAKGRGTATQGANTPQTTTPMTNLTGQGVNLSQMAASGNTTVQQNIEATLNSKSLVDNVAKGVEEGARRGSMEGSSQGITNLSENRQVQQQSTF